MIYWRRVRKIDLIVLVLVVFSISTFVYVSIPKKFHHNVEKEIEDYIDRENQEALDETLKEYESKIVQDLGHMGEAAFLEGKEERRGELSFKKLQMNRELSDRIPLNRTLKDPRHPNCKKLRYRTHLTASVVIIYHNELFSVILRTVWSVITQSPRNALKEIVLVDDGSTQEDLTGLVRHYVKTRIGNLVPVRIVDFGARRGLIKARLAGARAASGDVLVFLDAHCEATVGWLEPLLARIQANRTNVVTPIIDSIDGKDFSYSSDETFQVGAFTWYGDFTWIDIQDKGYDYANVAPAASPTMAGGLFAIERSYFWEVGSYDDQMKGWGGENLEMSFRIWQCGGRIDVVPCSRVGHVFKDSQPAFASDTHSINTARLAHVWMDDYKRYYLMFYPHLQSPSAVGDLTDRVALREALHCRGFHWYLTHVYPEKFIPDRNAVAYGQVRTHDNMCLDNMQLEDHVGPLGLYDCNEFLSNSQYFTLTTDGELRTEETCVKFNRKGDVRLVPCDVRRKVLEWRYFPENGSLYCPMKRKCLTSRGVGASEEVLAEACESSKYQKWTFDHLNNTVATDES